MRHREDPGRDRTIQLLGGVAMVGLVASIAYAAQFSRTTFLSVIATALGIATASAITGGILGFLFAIPRGRGEASADRPTVAGADDGGKPGASTARPSAGVRANTNLEDVSDWLTKILLGVGLTQLGAIGSGMARLSQALGPALGGAETSPVFALTVVLTYATTGFLAGYLWTRFYLGAAFQRAESEVLEEVLERQQELTETVEAVTGKIEDVSGKQERATQVLVQSGAAGAFGLVEDRLKPLEARLDQIAMGNRPLLEVVRGLAEEYERVRGEKDVGPQRTVEMTRIVSEARDLAIQSQEDLPTDAIRNLFRTGEGAGVIALTWIGARRISELGDLVIDAIRKGRSAFEQYQALRTALDLASGLTTAQRTELKTAIEDQMGGRAGTYITRDTDRWPLAVHLLQELGTPEAEPAGAERLVDVQDTASAST